jgi:hypothetical protein
VYPIFDLLSVDLSVVVGFIINSTIARPNRNICEPAGARAPTKDLSAVRRLLHAKGAVSQSMDTLWIRSPPAPGVGGLPASSLPTVTCSCQRYL